MNQNIKNIFISLLLMINISAAAQKKLYDIIHYTVPAGYIEKEEGGTISYSKTDGANWAQIAIYRHRNSDGDIQTDFDKDWNELVAPGRKISAPEKAKPATTKGFTVMSGSSLWQYNGTNVASMLTVYSNKKICVAILCNATAMPYLKEYQAMLGTLDLDAGKENTESNQQISAESNPPTSDVANNLPASINSGAVVGLWTDYRVENNGYINGLPQITGGYMRREYLLKADGTYIFRAKDWMVYGPKYILFIYETGTYSLTGNQIVLTPKQGKGEWWGKKTSTKEWGSLVKASDYKQEKAAYNFAFKYYSGSKDTALILKTAMPTERDGNSGDKKGAQEFQYKKRESGESLIDTPPGFKIST